MNSSLGCHRKADEKTLSNATFGNWVPRNLRADSASALHAFKIAIQTRNFCELISQGNYDYLMQYYIISPK